MQVTTLLTLTTSPSAHPNRDAAFRSASENVNRLFKRIRRNWPGRDIQYFLVWERTKSGWPHAHLLLRAPFIPQRWLSQNWEQLTGAKIVDIRAIKEPHTVAAYIAKYLTKDPAAPAGCKRYRCSRLFFSSLAPAETTGASRVSRWALEQASPVEVALTLQRQGLRIAAHPDGSYEAYPPGHPNAPLFESVSLDAKAAQVGA